MLLSTKFLIVVWLLRLHSILAAVNRNVNNVISCQLPQSLLNEIDSYEPVVRAIINEALNGSFKGSTWNELAYFTDTFGPRLSGSETLERSIDYVLNKSIEYELENVHGEPVTVPHWVRGRESATLLKPRQLNIAILGLGTSVGTPPEGITAEAIVVDSFEELNSRKDEVPGKIVIYNQKFVSYGETVKYRNNGGTQASKYGAVAALVRSVTPYSLYTPHTGHQSYGENVTKIPVASITVEDATLLKRMANRGELLEINLKMEARNLPPTISRNVIADFQGSANPEKIVIVSGHIDSWDVGQGAMDDGGGAFISWQAVKLLKHLNYRPRRTVRLIMWTAEEMGYIGALDFIKTHKSEQNNLQFVMESDGGTFTPLGIEYTGTDVVGCILQRIMNLCSPLGNMKVRSPSQGPDIATWINEGVPGASLWNQDDKYFYYHHTNADTMLVEDSEALDKGTALFAALSYILANLSIDLPRHK
ncbi:carboxypeptidase Q-like isoform X1 [Apis laboriosa]|uniref:carboxypeptidase Q-like isoform X1 n=1 Tax=Apis laboriosa TaxID=183418 RepID=UPI001CC7F7CD|nr:carboxypeptidase Q-like isoform X1 [Apis laboriosa]XP_043793849.1 carboxypeptidase Q-like isoform X1 [Apis laboriosa]